MSFIDLMGNTVWTDDDITRRTEAMLRAEFPIDRELILNRKQQGVMAGVYALSVEEQAEISRFQQLAFLCQQEGAAARTDMAVLTVVLQYEAAERRLAQVALVEGDAGYEQDLQERAQATADMAGVSGQVLEMVELRRG